MPNNDHDFPLTSKIVAGETIKDIMVQNAPTGSHSETGGDTPVQKSTEETIDLTAQTAEKAVPETAKPDDSETFVSGASKARQLGESRRKLAEGLLKIAKGDPEKGIVGRPDEVKQIIVGDPLTDKYFKKAWPKEYATLFGGITEEEYDTNLETIEKKAEAKVKAELLVEQLKIDRREDAFDFAATLGFTQTEADSLLELSEQLEGKQVAGKELDWKAAMVAAAHVIRPAKAKVGIPSSGSYTGPTPTTEEKVLLQDDALLYYAKRTGKKLDDVKESLKTVQANMKGNTFYFPM